MKKFETVFVYGTLKRGYGNHQRLLGSSKFLGVAKSDANYKMFASGVPFLIDCKEGHKVQGELYQVTEATLARLDHLEGHPDFYRREKRWFWTEEARPVLAWVYLYAHPERFKHDTDEAYLNTAGVLEWTP